MNRRLLKYIAVIIGLLFPFLLVISISRHHGGDVQTFIVWSKYWSKSLKNIYIYCKWCNYPFYGLLFSAGVISWMERLTALHGDELHQAFRIFLAGMDGIIFLLNYVLLRVLRIKYAIFISLLITILPSTWAGSALWGQIDVIVQIFMTLSIIFYLICMKIIVLDTEKKEASRSLLYFFFGGISLGIGVLTKQLFLFSVPAIIILWLFIIFLLFKTYGPSSLIKAIILTILVIIFTLLPDFYLNIPESYYSHLHYTTDISGHWRKIAGNGFNIWVFFEQDIWSSSTKPIFGVFSAFRIGLILYSLFMLVLLGTLGLQIYRFIHSNHKDPYYIAGLFVLSLGLSHLGFNVLVTGTHERYMYHGYPFLLIALFFFWLAEGLLRLRWIILILVCAIAYGVFVLSILGLRVPFFPFRNMYFQAAMHLFLLVFIFTFWIDLTLRRVNARIG